MTVVIFLCLFSLNSEIKKKTHIDRFHDETPSVCVCVFLLGCVVSVGSSDVGDTKFGLKNHLFLKYLNRQSML